MPKFYDFAAIGTSQYSWNHNFMAREFVPMEMVKRNFSFFLIMMGGGFNF